MTAEDFINTLPPLFLSETEKLALVSRVQSGDSEAETLLLRAFSPLILRIAMRNQAPGIELGDLLQAGCMGLIHAARRYDPKNGAAVMTYVHHCVGGYIWHEHRRRGVIARPRSYWVTHDALLAGCNGVQRAALAGALSLDFKPEGSRRPLAAFVAAPKDKAPDERWELVLKARESLRERDRKVFDLRAEGLTLREISKRIGVTDSRVDQIAQRAVRKIKEAIAEMGET